RHPCSYDELGCSCQEIEGQHSSQRRRLRFTNVPYWLRCGARVRYNCFGPASSQVPAFVVHPKRRDGRVAEGARLESVFRGNSNVGSNPTLSASNFSKNPTRTVYFPSDELPTWTLNAPTTSNSRALTSD